MDTDRLRRIGKKIGAGVLAGIALGGVVGIAADMVDDGAPHPVQDDTVQADDAAMDASNASTDAFSLADTSDREPRFEELGC